MLLAQETEGGGLPVAFWIIYAIVLVVYLASFWVVFTKAGRAGLGRAHPLLQHLGAAGDRRQARLVADPVPDPDREHHRIDHHHGGSREELREGHRVRDRLDPAADHLLSGTGVGRRDVSGPGGSTGRFRGGSTATATPSARLIRGASVWSG